MSLLVCFLSISLVALIRAEIQPLNTTEDKMQSQITSAIKFMCNNQFESNGQFLYKIELKQETIEIDVEDNNAARQGGGLYALGMYYRLNHKTHNDKTFGFSLTDCIANSMRYLSSKSLPIVFTSDKDAITQGTETYQTLKTERGEVMEGSTGATALSVLGAIEICIVDDHMCHTYMEQYRLWVQGLITMRNHKLVTLDNYTLTKGAFAKKMTDMDKTSAYYDSESYVALSRLLKYKKHLEFMFNSDEFWKNITRVVQGLDEYYIEYTGEDDAHWLLQAWYNRWVTMNRNIDRIDQFMNHYLVMVLMKDKISDAFEGYGIVGERDMKPRCYMMEAMVDIMHSVKVMMNHSQYNNDRNNTLYVFNDTLWLQLEKRYAFLTKRQIFYENSNDFYFEKRYDGGFVNSGQTRMRIDDTQHCACALMKLKSLLFMNGESGGDSDKYSYMDYDDPMIGVDTHDYWTKSPSNYDLMVSGVCLLVVIGLVNIIFFYWCYHYPKEQKQRNDLFWLGQTGLESATSDAGNGAISSGAA